MGYWLAEPQVKHGLSDSTNMAANELAIRAATHKKEGVNFTPFSVLNFSRCRHLNRLSKHLLIPQIYHKHSLFPVVQMVGFRLLNQRLGALCQFDQHIVVGF